MNPQPERRPSVRTFVAVGLALALAVAVFLGPLASSEPDGLERVSRDHAIAQDAEVRRGPDLPVALRGAIGVGLTFAIGAGLTLAVRRRGGGPRRADR